MSVVNSVETIILETVLSLDGAIRDNDEFKVRELLETFSESLAAHFLGPALFTAAMLVNDYISYALLQKLIDFDCVGAVLAYFDGDTNRTAFEAACERKHSHIASLLYCRYRKEVMNIRSDAFPFARAHTHGHLEICVDWILQQTPEWIRYQTSTDRNSIHLLVKKMDQH